MDSSNLLKKILAEFKNQGFAQVPGYYRFGYIRETNNSVIVSRETGQDTYISHSKIIQGIDAVRNDQFVYKKGPSALRRHGITHINSPIWALLHLLPLSEFYRLPDVLSPGLKIVFCGTAVGKKSATKKQYYAGSGNKFWSTLYKVGLVDRQLDPSEFQNLLEYGLGLTDLAKTASGLDVSLSATDFQPLSLIKKIKKYYPQVICFNGKGAAKHFFNTISIDYGFHDSVIDKTRFYIAPSTSRAAIRYWDLSKWQELANWAKTSA